MNKQSKAIIGISLSLILVLAVSILFINPVSSAEPEKNYNSAEKEYTITNSGYSATIKLISNTDKCDSHCFAVIKFRFSNDFTVPSDSNAYKTEFYNKAVQKITIQGYNYYILADRDYSCIKTWKNVLHENGTTTSEPDTYGTCTRKDWVPFEWKNYQFKKDIDYLIKLEGTKQPYQSVEWIKTFDNSRLDEWADWSSTGCSVNYLDYKKGYSDFGETTLNWTINPADQTKLSEIGGWTGTGEMYYLITPSATSGTRAISSVATSGTAVLSKIIDAQNFTTNNFTITYMLIDDIDFVGEHSYGTYLILYNGGNLFTIGIDPSEDPSYNYAYKNWNGGTWTDFASRSTGNHTISVHYDTKNGVNASFDGIGIGNVGSNLSIVPNQIGFQSDNAAWSIFIDDVRMWNGTECPKADATPPQWSNPQTNASDNTKIGQSVYFNVTLTDENPNNYRFSINQTGTWINYSGTYQSGIPIQEIKTITAQRGKTAGWYFWADDDSGNANQTQIQIFTVANTAPTQTKPLLSSTSGKNLNNDNLTCSPQSTYDADNDNVVNVFNWLKNNESLAVLNMPFETSVKDYSGKGNNGIINGAQSTAGKVGNALGFDGVDDYVEIADSSSLDITGNLTLEAWIYPLNVNGYHTFIAKGGENWVYINYLLRTNGDEIEFRWYNGGFENHKTNNVNLIANNWYHVVAVHNVINNIAKIYVNGEEKFSEPTTKSKIANPRPFSIGVDRDNSGSLLFPFNGSIDEINIYNKVLMQEQIKTHYNLEYNKIVSQETMPGETYKCEVTSTDGYNDSDTMSSDELSVLWAVTFDVTSGETGNQLNNFNINCNNSWSITGISSPYETGFEPGSYSCTFTKLGYFDKTIILVADNDKAMNITFSLSGYLSSEEHTWLEAIYNCIIGGDCSLYNLLLEMNQTIGNIWEHTKPTDESVITFENITNKVINSSNNLTIDYTVHIPIKVGYSLGTYLPIRIGFWFLDTNNETCYNQGDKPVGVKDPYCQPLVIETIGPMGGQVNFTVELQPNLPAGDYSVKRIIDIDPNNIWINYGQETISLITLTENIDSYGIGIKKTGEVIPEKEGLLQDAKSMITGAVTGINQLLLSGWQIVAIIAIVGSVLITFIISRTILRLKKK